MAEVAERQASMEERLESIQKEVKKSDHIPSLRLT